MVEILIDGARCDLEAGYTLPKNIYTLDGEALRKASKQQSGRNVKLRLPSTPCNDTIMLHATDPCVGGEIQREGAYGRGEGRWRDATAWRSTSARSGE